jgi:hypothetical protein
MRALTVAAAALAALTLTTVATAAPVYWTPAMMSKALTTLSYGHAGVIGVKCAGVGKPQGPRFQSFRCASTWQINPTRGQPLQVGTVKVFAKPMTAGRVCASTARISSCTVALGPLPGDPTVCNGGTRDAVKCPPSNAYMVVREKLGPMGGECTITTAASSRVVVQCREFTITYTRGSTAWTATVA